MRLGATAVTLAPISDAARSVAQYGGISPSRWDRLANDCYFKLDAPWIIPTLLSKVKIVGPVLEKQGFAAAVLVTDKLRFYGAARSEIGLSARHEQSCARTIGP
jgi:hypothetical protein